MFITIARTWGHPAGGCGAGTAPGVQAEAPLGPDEYAKIAPKRRALPASTGALKPQVIARPERAGRGVGSAPRGRSVRPQGLVAE